MSSESSEPPSPRSIEFGLYRNIDARTEEFLRLSRKRQIKQGCACAAASTAITVTVVIVVFFVYEFSLSSKTSLEQTDWVSLMNDTSNDLTFETKLTKANIDKTTIKLLPLLIKALNRNSILDKYIEDSSSPSSSREETTTEINFQKNVYKNLFKFQVPKLYPIEYKTLPVVYYKHPSANIEYFTKIRKIRDRERMVNYLDKMISGKDIGSTKPKVKSEIYSEGSVSSKLVLQPKTANYNITTVTTKNNSLDITYRHYEPRTTQTNVPTKKDHSCICPDQLGEIIHKILQKMKVLNETCNNKQTFNASPVSERINFRRYSETTIRTILQTPFQKKHNEHHKDTQKTTIMKIPKLATTDSSITSYTDPTIKSFFKPLKIENIILRKTPNPIQLITKISYNNISNLFEPLRKKKDKLLKKLNYKFKTHPKISDTAIFDINDTLFKNPKLPIFYENFKLADTTNNNTRKEITSLAEPITKIHDNLTFYSTPTSSNTSYPAEIEVMNKDVNLSTEISNELSRPIETNKNIKSVTSTPDNINQEISKAMTQGINLNQTPKLQVQEYSIPIYTYDNIRAIKNTPLQYKQESSKISNVGINHVTKIQENEIKTPIYSYYNIKTEVSNRDSNRDESLSSGNNSNKIEKKYENINNYNNFRTEINTLFNLRQNYSNMNTKNAYQINEINQQENKKSVTNNYITGNQYQNQYSNENVSQIMDKLDKNITLFAGSKFAKDLNRTTYEIIEERTKYLTNETVLPITKPDVSKSVTTEIHFYKDIDDGEYLDFINEEFQESFKGTEHILDKPEEKYDNISEEKHKYNSIWADMAESLIEQGSMLPKLNSKKSTYLEIKTNSVKQDESKYYDSNFYDIRNY